MYRPLARRGVVDAANKETILAGRIGGSGGGRIVALANGAEGQLVTLIAREPTTLVHGHADTAGMLGQPILTRGGGDKPLAAYESVRLVLDGGSWREVAEGCRAQPIKTDDASTKTTTRRPDTVAIGGGRDSKVNWWLQDRTDNQGSEFVAQHSRAATGIIPCFATWELYDDGTSWPDMSTFTGKW